jgi:cell division protein FtsQ
MTPPVGRPTLRERLVRMRGWIWRGLKRALPAMLALVLAGGVVTGALFVYRFVTTSPKFAIRVIELPPLKHARPQALLARMGIKSGTNIFRVDLDTLAHHLEEEPWISWAHVRRQLPDTITVEVGEREAAGLVVMGGLYLCDAEGRIFKHTSPGDGEGLPVVTGLERDGYAADPETAQAHVREALAAYQVFQHSAARQIAISEIHIDADEGVTLYTWEGGTEIRLGRGALEAKLQRFGLVWQALGADTARARAIYLGRSDLDRVIVRLAEPAAPPSQEPQK